MIPLDTPGSPWYLRKFAKKNLKFGGESVVKDREKEEIEEFINDTEIYTEKLKQKGKEITDDPNNFIQFNGVMRLESEDSKKFVLDESVKLATNNSKLTEETKEEIKEENKNDDDDNLMKELLSSNSDSHPSNIFSDKKVFSGKSILGF
jgi:hypothetical protein